MNTDSLHSTARRRPPQILFLPLAVLLTFAGGCALLQPAHSGSHYYLLAGSPDASAQTGKNKNGCVVRLLPVEVANYLQTQDIVVRTGTNEVKFALFHRWAEPLNAGVRRVLAGNLRAAPEIAGVITDEPSPANGRVYTVWLRVLACGGAVTNHHGSAVFEAAWEIGQSGSEVAQGVYQSPPADWHPGDYGQLANRLSEALGDFSGVLSGAISRQIGD